jgi:hypothetical protein
VKLKKRDERSHKPESLAYHGKKYRTDEYIPIIFQTEIGIYESHVMCDRTLTDDEVEAGLVGLIGLLREGTDLAVTPGQEVTVTPEDRQELVIECIRFRWQRLQDRGELPGRDELVGILRTILSSLETWRSKNMHAQGYLRFLEGFLKGSGVNVRMARGSPAALEGPQA